MNKDPKYICSRLIPGGRRAFVVYPYIFWSEKLKGWEDGALVKHEMYHWEEQRLWKENKLLGLTRWLLKFVIQWFWFNVIRNFPRDKHPMERPAYEMQYNCKKQADKFGELILKKQYENCNYVRCA